MLPSMSETLGSEAIVMAVVDVIEREMAMTSYVPAFGRARTTADPCAPVPPTTRTDCSFLPQDAMEYQSKKVDTRMLLSEVRVSSIGILVLPI